MQPGKILDLLQRLEFRTLARQLPDVMQVAIENHHADERRQHPMAAGKNVLIDTNEKAAALKLGDSEYFYIHGRSAGKHGRQPEVLIISLDGREYVYAGPAQAGPRGHS